MLFQPQCEQMRTSVERTAEGGGAADDAKRAALFIEQGLLEGSVRDSGFSDIPRKIT